MIFFFFFNDTATTEIYTLSLHDALPIFGGGAVDERQRHEVLLAPAVLVLGLRSEEHTSELQSQSNLVCRLLLEKKKKTQAIEYRGNIYNLTDSARPHLFRIRYYSASTSN